MRVVSGEFGGSEKCTCKEDAECDRRDERVGAEIDLLQTGPVAASFDESRREGFQLGEEGEDGPRERGAVRGGLDVRERERERHVDRIGRSRTEEEERRAKPTGGRMKNDDVVCLPHWVRIR